MSLKVLTKTEARACVRVCVCACGCARAPPPSPPPGLAARPELSQECAEHGRRDEGTENGTAGTSSHRGPLDTGAGDAHRGDADGEPRRDHRGARETRPDPGGRYQRRPPEPQLVPGPGNHHQREAHRAGHQARCWWARDQYQR